MQPPSDHSTPPILRCSFCARSEKEVARLIQGESDGRQAFICNDCVVSCHEIVNENRAEQAVQSLQGHKDSGKLPTPHEIKAALDDYVIGQEVAKRSLAVAVYNHYKRLLEKEKAEANKSGNKDGSKDGSKDAPNTDDVELSKSNVLLIGPTGSGKTLLAQTLARKLDVPFVMADATTLTEAGYVGEDVESIIQKLLQACEYDTKKAERGIVFIDEIDKITRKSANPSITRDVSGEGVQQALLKLVEGTKASIPPAGGRKHPGQDYLVVDTTNILFICGGAFAGLEKIVEERTESSGIGFGAAVRSKQNRSLTQAFKDIEPEDLIKYGLIPELVGRLPVAATLDELDEAALVRILTEPKNSVVKQFDKLIALEGARLDLAPNALSAIAKKAIARKTGARGLRSILENALLPTMYDLPSLSGVEAVRVDENTILHNQTPVLVRKGEAKAA